MHVYANWLQTALVQLQNTTVTMISTGHLTREYLICCEDAKKDCITLYYHDIIMPPRKESHPRASQSDLRIWQKKKKKKWHFESRVDAKDTIPETQEDSQPLDTEWDYIDTQKEENKISSYCILRWKRKWLNGLRKHYSLWQGPQELGLT